MEQQPQPKTPVAFTGEIPSLSDPKVQALVRDDDERWKERVEETSRPFDYGQPPNQVLRFKTAQRPPGAPIRETSSPVGPISLSSDINTTNDPLDPYPPAALDTVFTFTLSGSWVGTIGENIHSSWIANDIDAYATDVETLEWIANLGNTKHYDTLEDGTEIRFFEIHVVVGNNASIEGAGNIQWIQIPP